MSISAGFTAWTAADVVKDDISALIEDADVSLFEAKESGRDRAKG